MKYFGAFPVCLFLSFSCISDEERRLQTDQSYEGEEMFNISFSLDEHIRYAFNPFEFYRDTSNHAAFSGCPEIEVNEEMKQVSLQFGEGDCPTNRTGKRGKVILTYLDTLLQEDHDIRIDYEGYQVRGLRLDGTRFLERADSIIQAAVYQDGPRFSGSVDSISSARLYQDRVSDLILTDAQLSTSRINAEFTHRILYTDSLQLITTSGSASGRNLAGRGFRMEISDEKQYSENCVGNGFSVAESGEEIWTFERTDEPDVTHRIIFREDPDCNHIAVVQLQDGREINKTQ